MQSPQIVLTDRHIVQEIAGARPIRGGHKREVFAIGGFKIKGSLTKPAKRRHEIGIGDRKATVTRPQKGIAVRRRGRSVRHSISVATNYGAVVAPR